MEEPGLIVLHLKMKVSSLIQTFKKRGNVSMASIFFLSYSLNIIYKERMK